MKALRISGHRECFSVDVKSNRKTENKEINSLLSSLLFSWRARKTASLQRSRSWKSTTYMTQLTFRLNLESLARFSLECWKEIGFTLLRHVTGLKISRHLLTQSEAIKPNLIVTSSIFVKRRREWPRDHYFVHYVFCLGFAYKERQNGDGKTLNSLIAFWLLIGIANH